MNSSSMQFFFLLLVLPIAAFHGGLCWRFYGTRVPWTWVPCNFFFFLSLITPYTIFYKSSFTLKLDFEKIELQKKGISLISLGNGTKGCIICAKRELAQIPLLRMGCKFSNNLRILSTNLLNFTINVLISNKI